MFCDDCGRFALFRKRCADCEAERLRRFALRETGEASGRRRASASGSSGSGSFGSGSSESSSFHTETRVQQSTSIKIVINGKEVVLPSEGVTPELVQRLSAELDLPRTEIATLLASALRDNALDRVEEGTAVRIAQRTGTLARDVAGVRPKGPLKRIHCPQCDREIPERDWCLYCGHEFPEQKVEARDEVEARDQVDERFLTEDVEVEREGADEERVEERLRDSYRDRLEDL